MDGVVRIKINAEDIGEFRAWLKTVKAVKACHIDDNKQDGYVSARIMVGVPHKAGRIASYSPAQIVRMHDADLLSFGAISEQLNCSKATACDSYHNYYRKSQIRLENRIYGLKHAGCTSGWLYTTAAGDEPGLAEQQNEIPAGYTVLGQLADDIDKLLPKYVAARAAAELG